MRAYLKKLGLVLTLFLLGWILLFGSEFTWIRPQVAIPMSFVGTIMTLCSVWILRETETRFQWVVLSTVLLTITFLTGLFLGEAENYGRAEGPNTSILDGEVTLLSHAVGAAYFSAFIILCIYLLRLATCLETRKKQNPQSGS